MWQIDDLEGAKRAGDLFGYPLMIKSRRLAYDGRGNSVANSEEEISSAVTGEVIISYCDKNYFIILIIQCRY